MQGVNDYEDFATAILIGRLQPNAGALEEGLRGLFGDGQEPLEFLGVEASQLVASESRYIRSDGTLVPASVQTHPDARGAALLAQMREAASLQAMARLRLVSPSRPKRVLLLSSLPLPGVPVTELTTWEALTKDVSAETLAPAYQRLKRALHGPDGRLIAGLRLSNAGLTTDAPEVFPTIEAAREFRRGRSTSDIAAILRQIAQREGFTASPVRLTRRARGGRATPAVLFGAAASGYLPAEQIWTGVECAPVAWEDL